MKQVNWEYVNYLIAKHIDKSDSDAADSYIELINKSYWMRSKQA